MVLVAGVGVQLVVGAPWIAEQPAVPAGASALAATLVVTSTADSGPGTLRQALLDAGNGDTITFDPTVFSPASPLTITLTSALPPITQGNLTIDASNAGVILDGSGTPANSSGLLIISNGNVIRGLQILHFPGDGVEISGGAQNNTLGGNRTVGSGLMGQGNLVSGNGGNGISIYGAMSNTVSGNYIGTDVSGTTAFPNAFQGVCIGEGAVYNRIGGSTAGEGNLISGNGTPLLSQGGLTPFVSPLGMGTGGVRMEGTGTRYNEVTGNIIGLDARGQTTLSNHEFGVVIREGASENRVGGSTPGERNIISSNSYAGVGIYYTGTTSNTVVGNYIGTDVNGAKAIGNSHGVVILRASQNRIGGALPGEGNLLSGNSIGIALYWADTNENIIVGNLIGTDATGSGALANTWQGVYVGDGASFNRIGGSTAGERNLISGNAGYGVRIEGSSTVSNVVSGNYIGTNISGTAAIRNIYSGVTVSSGASYNRIGGTTAGERNVISGNGGDGGVYINNAPSNTVSGNFIGTDPNGAAALGNSMCGVSIYGGASNNRIGGSTPGERNLISGNGASGVCIIGSNSQNNIVRGNLIGTDVSGAIALGNGRNGVALVDGAQNNAIGGTTDAERNIISGNKWVGVSIGIMKTITAAHHNLVIGNYIGTDISGMAAMGNKVGVDICNGASDNTIGGTTAGERNVIAGSGKSGVHLCDGAVRNRIIGNYLGSDASGAVGLGNGEGVGIDGGAQQNVIGPGNLIAYNTADGVWITGATTLSNTVTQNSIYSNTGLGIHNVNGGNGELTPPTITRVSGRSMVTGAACANCTVEVFSDAAEEGRVYEANTTAAADGRWAVAVGHALSGPNITATATDPDGNTSEFCRPVALVDNTPPAVSNVAASPLQLAPGGTVTITAYVLDPVNGVAVVTATVHSRNPNFTTTLLLYDDGAHGDGTAGDDVYGNRWLTPTEPREYLVDIAAIDSGGYETDYCNQISFSTAPLPAMPGGDWVSWSNANFVRDLVFQGNTLWAATEGGVVRWDTVTGGSTKYTVADGMANNNSQAIVIDHDGKVWAGGYGRGGISIWDGSAWQRDERFSWLLNITDMAVDSANRIWLGSDDGVMVVAGSVITTYNTGNSGLTNNQVRAVVIDNDNNKWFGTYGGVSKLAADGTWTTYNTSNSGLAYNAIAAIGIDAAGNKWFGYDMKWGVGLSKLAVDGTWTYYTIDSGLATNFILAIAFDSGNRSWFGGLCFGGASGVSVLSGTIWTNFTAANSGLANGGVYAIAVDGDDNLWFGAYGGGISKLQAGSWSPFLATLAPETSETSPADEKPRRMFGVFDPSVEVYHPLGMWDGLISSPIQPVGIRTAAGGVWTTYTVPDRLPHNYVHGLAVDAQRRAWFGTHGGAAMYDGSTWVTYTSANSGLYNNFVWSVSIDQSDRKWFAGWGVSVLSGATWITYTTANSGLIHDLARGVAFDRAGRAWIATQGGVSVFSGATWLTYTTANSGLPNNTVSDVLVDRADVKWFATAGGLSRFDGATWTNYTTAEGLPTNNIYALALDNDGRLWFSPYCYGVAVLDTHGTADKTDDLLLTFTVADGLASNCIRGLAVDAQGRKWFGSSGYGVSVLDDRSTWGKADDRWLTFTSVNGLANNYPWAVAISPDGKTRWFGTLGGVSRFREVGYNIYLPLVPKASGRP
jgi:ligand-binding sensor domain-containing protein